MATEIKVGQTLPLSIRYLDQNGREMAATPIPDAPPAWGNSSPAVETLTAAPDGATASAFGLAAGSDTIRVQLAVNGIAFTATLDVTVAEVVPTQTLTSVEIVAGTPTP